MNPEQKTKRIQLIRFFGLLGIIVAVIFACCKFFDSSPKRKAKEASLEPGHFNTAADRVDMQSIWRSDIEETQRQTQQQLKTLETIIKNQQKEEENKLGELHDLVSTLNAGQPKSQQVVTTTTGEKKEVAPEEPGRITKLTLNLSQQQNGKLTTIDNTIPAGSFVKAILLSGVDAIAAINADSNPRPLLLRLTDLTVLPRRFRTDLVDCHCTASGWGELSSERVHARLVKLSCVERATGEILEVPVNGFVAGGDGREGIRGVVASKEGQFLTRSLWGGVFAGIGNTLSPANQAARSSPLINIGNEQKKAPVKDMFKSGFAESSGSSLNRLSEYYIDRAEQIQPVIQIAAGQEVDLVFTEGAAIDQSLIRKKVSEQNDVERKKTAGS